MTDAELTRVICTHLGVLDGWIFHEDVAPYPLDRVGVFYGDAEPHPNMAVGVRVYNGFDALGADPDERRVQIITRGAPGARDGADRLADTVRTVLLQLPLLSVGVAASTRISFGPLGADKTYRELRSDNYQFILDNREALLP